MELNRLFVSGLFLFPFFNLKELGQHFPELPNMSKLMRKENSSHYYSCFGEDSTKFTGIFLI